MKKVLLVLLLLTAGFFTSCSDDCTQDALSTKVATGYSKTSNESIIICHVLPNGNTETLSIDASSLQKHLDHGDSEGECPTLSDGGLNFSDGNIVEIACKYELPFIHVNDKGETWLFESPK